MARKADASQTDRVPFVDAGFQIYVSSLLKVAEQATPRPSSAPLCDGGTLTCGEALALFDAQLESRHVDYASRHLKKRGASFYTISSAGHEGNAAVAAALRPGDPAFLHYRSGGFFCARAQQAGYEHAARDMLLGVAASAEEPIAGGRHKVFGSVPLAIPPQTSTIASHLPKAVGAAFALSRARRIGIDTQATAPGCMSVAPDAVVVCSFGDASANHSTAVGAIHAACWAAFQGQHIPILFVCEDNGLGISVPTPARWIESAYGNRPGLTYFAGDGLDLASAHAAAAAAVQHVRRRRLPAFLHLRVVRLLGHAGSDIETGYRDLDAIEASEARDPLFRSAELLVRAGAITPAALIQRYEAMRERVAALAEHAAERPKILNRAAVVAPLAARDDAAIARAATQPTSDDARRAFFGKRLPEAERPQPLGSLLNRALGDLLVDYPELLIFGEDVGKKGGVYGVTRGLAERARVGRVFDTLLDEQTILGTAIGAGQLGLLPIAEIQYLAYLHNAIDQLRGEAASLSFFSNGQLKNPMVVRIAGYAYQKGFGGHFHNDNAIASLRDIPGLVIASPSRGDDAVAMLRTCVAAARTAGSVCVFLEPIALYPQRDLHADGDSEYCFRYDRSQHVPIGEGRVHGDGRDLLIASWANGLWLSLRVAARLAAAGIAVRVLDLRWLSPLPTAQLLAEAQATGKVLIVDETRRSGGVSEALFTALVEGGFSGPMVRVAAEDSFIPLGAAADHVLVSEAAIEAAATELARR